MDILWICSAFAFGFVVKSLRLPTLVGYLVAGFALHAYGVEYNTVLDTLADKGIILLLFTIGLKLDVKNLLKPEICAVAVVHMAVTIVAGTCLLLLLAIIGMAVFDKLSWQGAAGFAFALSFSSTVCAIKILEAHGDMATRHGQVAIGVLVIQDIIAVIFMTASGGKFPSVWALGLLLLPLAKPVLNYIIEKSGHSELLCLSGFFMAFAGAELFKWVGLKPDLGALVFGILLAPHAKSGELSKVLFNFKELFLIAFFLSIGFQAELTWEILFASLILCAFLIVKGFLFFHLFSGFRMRSRDAFISSCVLFNFSEFGLIVGLVCVKNEWMSQQLLVVIALSLSISFVISTLMNFKANAFYDYSKQYLNKFQSSKILAEDKIEKPGKMDILIVGMSDLGRKVYQSINTKYKQKVYGMDNNRATVEQLKQTDTNVFFGDAQDINCWETVMSCGFDLVILTTDCKYETLEIARILRDLNYKGKITAIAHFRDHQELLQTHGIDVVFDSTTELASGYAQDVMVNIYPNAKPA